MQLISRLSKNTHYLNSSPLGRKTHLTLIIWSKFTISNIIFESLQETESDLNDQNSLMSDIYIYSIKLWKNSLPCPVPMDFNEEYLHRAACACVALKNYLAFDFDGFSILKRVVRYMGKKHRVKDLIFAEKTVVYHTFTLPIRNMRNFVFNPMDL